MNKIIEKAQETGTLSKKEIIKLLSSDGYLLYKAANSIREKYKGNYVHLRGLIEFTNICKRNCLYCGLRRDNDKIDRYRLSVDEVIETAKIAKELGFKTVVLQGGEDSFFNMNKICKIIENIKKLDIAITLSIGERSYEDYKAFKQAGADRYLLRIETTDKELYKALHPDMSFDNRMECLYNIKSLGYETGTGIMAGLPNQSLESIAEDILFFKKLNADMVGIGPFIANPNTPLKNEIKNNFDIALKTMAVTRLLMPDINIPATTAMETLNPNGRIIALQSGANVVMPNVTSTEYRTKYELYPGKICVNDAADKCINCITAKIKSIGREISTSKGFRND